VHESGNGDRGAERRQVAIKSEQIKSEPVDSDSPKKVSAVSNAASASAARPPKAVEVDPSKPVGRLQSPFVSMTSFRFAPNLRPS
jgi:hypothetical protein